MEHQPPSRPPSIFLIGLFFNLVILALFTAVLNNQWELTLLCGFVIGLVAAVKLWSRVSLHNLSIRPALVTERVFCGDSVTLAAGIKNDKALPVWIQLQANIDSHLRLRHSERSLSKETWLLWYQNIDLKFELSARQRGVHTIGPFNIRGGDLLGFSSSDKTISETYQVIVYPRLRTLMPIRLPRCDPFGLPGSRHPIEDPIYLLGTRDYQSLRPAKYIHWKASARLNRLQEKLCESSAREKVLIVIDVSQFEQRNEPRAFEEMLEVAASLAVQLNRRGLALGLLSNGRTYQNAPSTIAVRQNNEQITRILDTLARLEMQAEGTIADRMLTGNRLSAGVSYAYFSHHLCTNTRESKHAFQLWKMSGAVFVCQQSEISAAEDIAVSDVHCLQDICVRD